MGVIKQGILGGFSGKVANVVGTSWKGIAVIKSLPLSVANPRTPAQVEQRERMAGTVEAARMLLAALIQPYWNPFAQRESGYNSFVSQNIATFVAGVFTTFASFFSTRGSLLGINVTAVTGDASDSQVVVTWTPNTGQSDALGTDEMVITYYNSTQGYWVNDIGNATRTDGTLTIPDTVLVAADQLQVYISVARPDISKVADSVYQNAVVSA